MWSEGVALSPSHHDAATEQSEKVAVALTRVAQRQQPGLTRGKELNEHRVVVYEREN